MTSPWLFHQTAWPEPAVTSWIPAPRWLRRRNTITHTQARTHTEQVCHADLWPRFPRSRLLNQLHVGPFLYVRLCSNTGVCEADGPMMSLDCLYVSFSPLTHSFYFLPLDEDSVKNRCFHLNKETNLNFFFSSPNLYLFNKSFKIITWLYNDQTKIF